MYSYSFAGVFAGQPIAKNTFVGVYAGEYLTDEEGTHRGSYARLVSGLPRLYKSILTECMTNLAGHISSTSTAGTSGSHRGGMVNQRIGKRNTVLMPFMPAM